MISRPHDVEQNGSLVLAPIATCCTQRCESHNEMNRGQRISCSSKRPAVRFYGASDKSVSGKTRVGCNDHRIASQSG
ncbi:hypothetical protein KM043_015104 [Ampulex compressa]|nr:hypothetical protein KM043_015104 [Ampulex compressa]